MTPSTHVTIGEVAEIFQAPQWKVRRIVDAMGADIQRAGLYRLIPRSLLPAIGAKLQGAVATQEGAR